MILIVDDDRSVTASLALLLKQAGYPSHSVGTPAQALEWVRENTCELVIQDMNFSRRTSGEEGLTLIGQLKALRPTLPVILITAWGSIQLAVEGMKAGASDFVTKPWTNQQILHTVQTALGLASTRPQADESVLTREELDGKYDFGDLIGEDPRLLRILQVIASVAATRPTICRMRSSRGSSPIKSPKSYFPSSSSRVGTPSSACGRVEARPSAVCTV